MLVKIFCEYFLTSLSYDHTLIFIKSCTLWNPLMLDKHHQDTNLLILYIIPCNFLWGISNLFVNKMYYSVQWKYYFLWGLSHSCLHICFLFMDFIQFKFAHLICTSYLYKILNVDHSQEINISRSKFQSGPAQIRIPIWASR